VRYQDEVGDLEYKWTREYGTAFRVAGCYGVRASFSYIIFSAAYLSDPHAEGHSYAC